MDVESVVAVVDERLEAGSDGLGTSCRGTPQTPGGECSFVPNLAAVKSGCRAPVEVGF